MNNKHDVTNFYFVIEPGVPEPVVPFYSAKYELIKPHARRIGAIVTNNGWLAQNGWNTNRMHRMTRLVEKPVVSKT